MKKSELKNIISEEIRVAVLSEDHKFSPRTAVLKGPPTGGYEEKEEYDVGDMVVSLISTTPVPVKGTGEIISKRYKQWSDWKEPYYTIKFGTNTLCLDSSEIKDIKLKYSDYSPEIWDGKSASRITRILETL